MAINFNAGLQGGLLQNSQQRQKLLDHFLPSTEKRTQSVSEDWVNEIYKNPGEMFVIKNGKLTGKDGWSGMPTKEGAWNRYVELADEKNVKPNRAFFEQHYNVARQQYDQELSNKLEAIKGTGQFSMKDIQKAMGTLDINDEYYGNMQISPFLSKTTKRSMLDYGSSAAYPAYLGFKGVQGAMQGSGVGAGLKAGYEQPGKFASKYFKKAQDLYRYSDKKMDAVTDGMKNVTIKDMKKSSKDSIKIAKDLYGKNVKSSAGGMKALKQVMNTKGASGIAKDIFEKYGYKKGMLLLGKIFGKGALTAMTTPLNIAPGIGTAVNVGMAAMTAKDIYDIATDLYGEKPLEEGTSI